MYPRCERARLSGYNDVGKKGFSNSIIGITIVTKLHIALISIKFLNNKNFTHLLKQKILKQSLAFFIFSI